ncbi:MAG: prepilin-type N-terminal cleavage/methylation domain-containing protein [Verrucomicrobiota bacterium]|nr:prepilin-type N-terminal cleavage/methylation domain-containing protein [Verrucomicrobiota bacterium]
MISDRRHAFTLIELLVVIAIIAVLMGLAFPAFQSVQNSAKRTQAKNDLTQLVTAVNAFYTEYGRYPTTQTTDAQAKYGPGGGDGNDKVMDELRAIGAPALNTKAVVFISPPDAKDQNTPRGGIKTATREWYDPWGTAYALQMDADYDNKISNPYSSNAGAADVRVGVIAWSLGKDKLGGSGDKNAVPAKDDVISWQ